MQRDDYRDDKPVTRGQWKAIAEETLRVLGEPVPGSRYDGTVMLARLAATPDGPGTERPAVAAVK